LKKHILFRGHLFLDNESNFMSTHRQCSFEFKNEVVLNKNNLKEFVRSSDTVSTHEKEGDRSLEEVFSSFIEEQVDIYQNYLYLQFPSEIRRASSSIEFLQEFLEQFTGLKRALYQRDNDTACINHCTFYEISQNKIKLIDEVKFGQAKNTLMRPSKDSIEWIDEEIVLGRHRYRETVDYFRVKHNFKARTIYDLARGAPEVHVYNETGPESLDDEKVIDRASQQKYINYNYRGGVEERWNAEEE